MVYLEGYWPSGSGSLISGVFFQVVDAAGQLLNWSTQEFEIPASADLSAYRTPATQVANRPDRYAASVEIPDGAHAVNFEVLVSGTYQLVGEGKIVVSGGSELSSVAVSQAGAAAAIENKGATLADAVWDCAEAIDGKTPREALRIMAAVLAGKVSGGGTHYETFKGLDGETIRVQVTVDAAGNRSAVNYG
jgi:hypothetical protein